MIDNGQQQAGFHLNPGEGPETERRVLYLYQDNEPHIAATATLNPLLLDRETQYINFLGPTVVEDGVSLAAAYVEGNCRFHRGSTIRAFCIGNNCIIGKGSKLSLSRSGFSRPGDLTAGSLVGDDCDLQITFDTPLGNDDLPQLRIGDDVTGSLRITGVGGMVFIGNGVVFEAGACISTGASVPDGAHLAADHFIGSKDVCRIIGGATLTLQHTAGEFQLQGELPPDVATLLNMASPLLRERTRKVGRLVCLLGRLSKNVEDLSGGLTDVRAQLREYDTEQKAALGEQPSNR